MAEIVYQRASGEATTAIFAVDGSSVTVPNPLALSAVAAAKTSAEEETRAKSAVQASELVLKKAEEVR